jgi:PAB1-binding protein PBP1
MILCHAAQQQDFETDSSVGRRTDLRDLDGRDLQSVSTSWLTPETSTSLEAGGGGARGGIGQWNQFEANKRLYNVQNTYDENIYTKKLDKNGFTKEQLKKVDKVARSIETSTSGNIVLKVSAQHSIHDATWWDAIC